MDTLNGQSVSASNYVCPVCGAQMLSPSTLCSGSFLDAAHPPNVVPIIGTPPIRQADRP